MDGKEFRKYATMHKGMSGMAVDNYIESSIRPMRGMTPYILEERQMNKLQILYKHSCCF